MKLELIENPHNTKFLWITEVVDGQQVKRKNLVKDVMLTPLKTTEPERDPLIVQSLKIASGNPAGFSVWEDASAFLDSIPDATAYAAALGHDINALLED